MKTKFSQIWLSFTGPLFFDRNTVPGLRQTLTLESRMGLSRPFFVEIRLFMRLTCEIIPSFYLLKCDHASVLPPL